MLRKMRSKLSGDSTCRQRPKTIRWSPSGISVDRHQLARHASTPFTVLDTGSAYLRSDGCTNTRTPVRMERTGVLKRHRWCQIGGVFTEGSDLQELAFRTVRFIRPRPEFHTGKQKSWSNPGYDRTRA